MMGRSLELPDSVYKGLLDAAGASGGTRLPQVLSFNTRRSSTTRSKGR